MELYMESAKAGYIPARIKEKTIHLKSLRTSVEEIEEDVRNEKNHAKCHSETESNLKELEERLSTVLKVTSDLCQEIKTFEELASKGQNFSDLPDMHLRSSLIYL